LVTLSAAQYFAMPVTTYEDSSQDFAPLETNSFNESDSFLGFARSESDIIPESSSAGGVSSQSDHRSNQWRPDPAKWLIITSDEATQMRAANILKKVQCLHI